MTALIYHRGDERPAWVETVLVNGVADDMTSGYSFVVKLYADTVLTLTKTAFITGAAGGEVTVAWADGELNITPGVYRGVLVATRTSDSAEWTVTRDLLVMES